MILLGENWCWSLLRLKGISKLSYSGLFLLKIKTIHHFCIEHDAPCAKFMNLELDDRPIEHKSSTKLLGVHIDEMLTWDNQIKHISSKVSNGLRMLYLARKLTDNQETLKTIYYSLVQPYFDYRLWVKCRFSLTICGFVGICFWLFCFAFNQTRSTV